MSSFFIYYMSNLFIYAMSNLFIHAMSNLCIYYKSNLFICDMSVIDFGCKQEVGIWRVKQCFPRYGVPIWCLWPNIRFLPSTVTEKNVTKNESLYPRSPKGEGGILFYLCPSVRPSSVQDIFRHIFLSNWETNNKCYTRMELLTETNNKCYTRMELLTETINKCNIELLERTT
jgi:hypothetical protein